MSPDSAAWCAERGFKMATGWLPTVAAAALGAKYREAAEKVGRKVTPSMLGLRRRVFVADTDAEAQEKFEAATDLMLKFAGEAFETADEKVKALLTNPDDFAVGSPETVAERLIEQCRAGGYGVMLAYTDSRLFDAKTFDHCHRLIGTRVAPILRSANIDETTLPTSQAADPTDALGSVNAGRASSHAMAATKG